MLYTHINQNILFQIIEYQISNAIGYLNERFEAGKNYVEQRYNNLASYYRNFIDNFVSYYEKAKLNFIYSLNNLENNLFRVLFAKQNQETIKTPGNGHAGNNNGSGSKKPTSTPDKKKGGQNGPKQK